MPQLLTAERKAVVNWLSQTDFSDHSHKYKRGHALVVAGSADYSGAAVLCANAAMRSGVGLVTMYVPASVKAEVASRVLPEVIVKAITENDGEGSNDAFGAMSDTFRKANAIAVGCGLSVNDKGVGKLFREIVENRKAPVIVDASALSFMPHILRKSTQSESDKRTSPELILTPHDGEFLRLLGTDDKEAIQDRIAAVRDFASKNNVILVLKGEGVLIGAPDGRVVVNPTGNSGLGKAGNGDTLAGILAGFTAQASKKSIDIFETAVAAVYVAGMAGDIAEKKFGKRVMTASDVRECLADAFLELSIG